MNKMIELHPNEKVKGVKDYPGYAITDHGRVISYTDPLPKLLKLQVDGMGYNHVRLYNSVEPEYYSNGMKKPKLFKVHRLVADHFLWNSRKKCVNHKDCDKQNNHFSNLEWVTHQENTDHAWENGRMANLFTIGSAKRSHKLKVTYKDGKVLYFRSKVDLVIYSGAALSTVNRRVKGGDFGNVGFKVEQLKEIPEGVEIVDPASLEKKKRAYYLKYWGKTRFTRK